MDESAYSTLKKSLSSVSANALNYSCRLTLAKNLQSTQTLQSEKGFARDYRGLADLMGFQYHEIKEYEAFDDCTMKILEGWEARPNATLDKLIGYLEDMDRQDVIEELIPLLKKSVETYTVRQKSGIDSDIVAETKDFTIYDAYVSYAEEDYHIAAEFAHLLETPRLGLKLFIRGRDKLEGISYYELENDIDLIKKKCKHILILLTPNFIKSPALEFLVLFDSSLETDQKHRILIPAILEPCEVPSILLNLSKIDLTKEYLYECMWNRLVTSLLPEDNLTKVLSTFGGGPVRKKSVPSNSASAMSAESILIATGQLEKSLLSNKSCSTDLIVSSPADNSNIVNKNTDACRGVSSPSKTDSSSNKFHQFISLIRRMGSSTSSSSPSLSPATTNGIHNHSCSKKKGNENSSAQRTSL